jgi:hypothetical protein
LTFGSAMHRRCVPIQRFPGEELGQPIESPFARRHLPNLSRLREVPTIGCKQSELDLVIADIDG